MRLPSQRVRPSFSGPSTRILTAVLSQLKTEIRPYMYRALMTLVGIHAQISRVAEGLLERALQALVEDVAEEALRSFMQVKRFGMGGMLRVSVPVLSRVTCQTQTLLMIRRPSRSNSCTRRWRATSLPPQPKPYPSCTTRYPWHMPDDQGTRTSRVTSTASRRRLLRVDGRRELSSCVSGSRRIRVGRSRRRGSRHG